MDLSLMWRVYFFGHISVIFSCYDLSKLKGKENRMLIILVVIVVGFYLYKEKGGFQNQEKNEPLKHLKTRYINDEVTEEEYRQKKKILEEK